MSGLAVLFRKDGNHARTETLHAMIGQLAHRGSATAIQTRESAGLAIQYNRTDAYTTPDNSVFSLGTTSIVCDARIDNRDELLAALGLAGGAVCTEELLLRAYMQWDSAMPERLLGDFAFAIWDERTEEFFCARDHFGVRPLYYFDSPNLFAAGTEIKAVLALADVPRTINQERVAELLALVPPNSTSTIYSQIRRLPPAHWIRVGRGGVSIERYWRLDPGRGLRLGSDGEYAEAFQSLFTSAVQCRLESSQPVGAFLSGGLDSSSIVCTARNVRRSRNETALLPTYSAVYDQLAECDEREYIHTVVKGGGVDPHEIVVDGLDPLAELDRMLWHLDEPHPIAQLYLSWALFGSACANGTSVLLDGLLGDDVVSHGVGVFGELAAQGSYVALFRESRKYGKGFGVTPARVLWHRAVKPVFPAFIRKRWEQSRGSDDTQILRPEFQQLLPSETSRRREVPPTERADHYNRLNDPVIGYGLEKNDHVAAAFGIEPRYPFLDKRLAEFCLSLPPAQKMRDGVTRVILRNSMLGVLPEEIRLRRNKQNLSPGFAFGVLSHDMGSIEALAGDLGPLEPFVVPDRFAAIVRRFLEAKSPRDAHRLWGAVVLERWLRNHG